MVTRGRSYDAVVAGGGPAGATAAALIADTGLDVLLVERSSQAQFKVGESLMPATYDVLARLGVLQAMQESDYPQKWSVQFYGRDGKPSRPFYFQEFDPAPSSQTWQVLRSTFDQMLVDNAARKGAEILRGAAVTAPLLDGETVVGGRIRLAGGDEADIRCRVLVDATGQSSLLARRFDLRLVEPSLRNVAYFTHCAGARFDTGIDAGATIIFNTVGGGSWFWFIPLPGDRVSVGVVGDVGRLVTGRARDPEQVFEEELIRCPALAERLAGARRLMPIQAVRDFSYTTSRGAGEGWLLAGDAFGFIDPIYSTGVFLALQSGAQAADAVIAALAVGEPSAERLGAHLPELRRGVEALRRLVYAFYDEDFSFGRFLERYPDCRESLVHMLMGNVFTHPMEGLLAALEEHLAKPVPEDAR
jgi:flavin-dependent dehydrogenase